MALVLKDRVKQAAAAPGTGTITLGATTAGFQSFASVGNGNTTYFAIVDPVSGDWEVNYGVYTSSGTTLTRNSPPLSSSNAGSLVNFTGAVDVFLTYPSEKAVWQDTSGVVAQQSFGAITATSAALTTGTVSTTPASNTDIANKQYVDGLVTQGISYHEPVYVESPNTTGNLNATYNNGASGVGATLTNAGTQVALTVDGILMTVGKRVLIYNQTNATQNGVYTVTTVGSGSTNWVLTRSADANTYGIRDPNALGYNDAFFVTNGDTGAGETYVCTTTGTITFGTTNITFAQISSAQVYTAGTGLNLSPATTFNISNTGVSASTYGSASAVPVFAVNAQGQLTSVTNTNIAINGSQVSGNISGSAGSVANALTFGTYLTGGTYNGSAAVTATVDATSANTASKVVARDSSGNFSAGTITATLNGTATSTASATNLSGGAANQIAYQSATNTTAFATAPSASNQVLNWNGSAFTWSAGTISGVPLGSNLNSLTAGSYLTGTAYNGSAAQTWTVDATSANTASKVVARDGSGNFSAGTITASLSGNATTATTASTLNGYTQDTAATANTIVLRDGGGDIYQRYGFAVHFNQSSSNTENPTIAAFWTNSGSDGYNRKSSPAHVISQLGLLTTSNYNSYAPTLTGTGASGTWNINVTGSAGSAPGYLPLSGGTMTGSINSNVNTVIQSFASGVSRGYLYQDSSGFGLLTGAGSWAVRVDIDSNQIYIPGYAYSGSSFRAPIFYDSDNTGYYVDPASTSDTALRMRGGALFGPNTTWGAYLAVGGNGNISTSYASVAATDGNLHMDAAAGHDMYLNYYAGNAVRAYGTFYANNLYDLANTGYYLDPASTSELNKVYYNSNMVSRNHGIGQVGLYSSYRYQALFSMGEAYILPADGTTTGNLYGVAYSHPNAGGAASNLASHGILMLENGTFQGAWGGGSLRTPGDIRGTIFYDWNNTGYYLDLNGSSNASTNLYGTWYFTSNFNTGSGSSAPLQAYSSGGSGAVMSFHRGGYYAVNFGLDSDNVMRIGGWSASANLFQMDMSGNLTMAANVTAYSDETLKKDWADMPSDFVPRLARVKSGTYTRIDNEMRQIGVGAQSLRPLMEEAVFENADGTLSVAYGNAAMASSVELARYVTALEQRISQLEARI